MIKKIIFKNKIFSKKELKHVIYEAFTSYGIIRSCLLADELKELGFDYATKAGISISIEDLKIPPSKKNLLSIGNKEILKSDISYLRGEINSVERFQKVIDTWNKTSEALKSNLISFFNKTDPLNPIYLMAFSGARGNLSQVRQLVGMRGLMSDPNGQIIDIPIIHNFREGLTITDYIMSAYGARKGVVDTALRTADSGYLTRRLIDVAQDVIIREYDCLTKRSIKIYRKEDESLFFKKILGRTSAETIFSQDFNTLIISEFESITEKIAEKLILNNLNSIKIYSPLTCESTRSICQKCYGWDLSNSKLVSLGEAIGIIAAQSIGEPGTQLTMRTFHTGGIFTSDASRQIIAKTNGLFLFNDNIQTKDTRTLYGSNILILERESNFSIIDYKNITSNFILPADSFIFFKSNTFIKKGDLIAELPYKNQQTIKSRKNIIASNSGQIIFSAKKNVIWILHGDVYDILPNTFFNDFLLKTNLSKKDNLFYLKLVAKKSGIIKIIKDFLTNQIKSLQISECFQTFYSYPVFWDKKKRNLILALDFLENRSYYLIKSLPKIVKQKSFLFAEYLSTKYQTRTGGQIILPSTKFFDFDSSYQNDVIFKNGKILFIPLETYKVNKDKNLLLVPNKTKLTSKGIEIISGIFSLTDGFLQIKESNQIIQEIEIKPGQFFEYLNLTELQIFELKILNKKIYFPGEIVFEDILITYLTLIEIIKTKNSYAIILRPVKEFNIPKPQNNININLKNVSKNLKFTSVYSLRFNTNNKDGFKKIISLIQPQIWLQSKKFINNQNSDLFFKLINYEESYQNLNFQIQYFKNFNKNIPNNLFVNFNSKKNYYLTIISQENINVPSLLSKKLTDDNLKMALYVKNLEYVEKETLLAKVSLIPKSILSLDTIKNQIQGNLKFLFISKKNHQTYFNEFNSFLPKLNELITVGDKLTPLLKTKSSGKIIKKTPFRLTLHYGTPFFVTTSTKLFIESDNFIKQDELLGLINFEQIVTGDIVQGLPKIEEILEARKPQNPAILADNPGVIAKVTNYIDLTKLGSLVIYSNNKNKMISGMLENISKKLVENIDKPIIIKKNQFVYVGQPLTEGSVNPHNLLMTYFDYYKSFTNDFESAYLSFKNLQVLLIEKVQQVYIMQGVTINDKHLEVIVKRITSKIQISKMGHSFLLPGEILELKQIDYINQILIKSAKKPAIFYPILLGITKASLLSDSFISAASFQETNKILTSAAIEGKIDWLRGLKENVIIGRLIPVGTGFIDDKNQKI